MDFVADIGADFALSAICSGLINIVISRAPEKKVLRIQSVATVSAAYS